MECFGIKLPCRREEYPQSMRTVYVFCAKALDGSVQYFCNGCDDLNGFPACENCRLDTEQKLYSGELKPPFSS